jgi:ergothioneine biosynthesis protein EgtB
MRTEAPSMPRQFGAAADRYASVRNLTECLSSPLSPEDQAIQSMPDVSPTKWHRAHTTWFFETFVLTPNDPTYSQFHPRYEYLFNSYYEAVGPRHPRAQRGLLSRPGAAEIARYRCHVDAAMEPFVELLDESSGTDERALAELIELGLHHEQQHQELLLMDIKHVLSVNPLQPAYRDDLTVTAPAPNPPLRWIEHEGGLVEIGHDGNGFAFDNESPRHTEYLQPFALADRPVTCGDWLAFMADRGYDRPELWLSDGWALRNAEAWCAPSYWSRDGDDDDWTVFTLGGPKPVDPAEPVCHISYYEADAYAHWSGARLPTETEWEVVAASQRAAGNFLDLQYLHPRAGDASLDGPALFGDVWEWTGSAYLPYPRFRPAPGAVGEYNGKFMVNQHVLRGGCCATPPGHTRATYRNFFPPASRWAFSGARLAKDDT